MDFKQLTDAGFKEYPVHFDESYTNVRKKNNDENFHRMWVKPIVDERGKRYFLAIRYWRYDEHELKEKHTFDAVVQFDVHGKDSFSVNRSVKDMTPDDVVVWFNMVFDRMGCEYLTETDKDARMQLGQ